MFLGIIAKFLGQKKRRDASEMSRQVENSNYSMKTGEYVVQEKDKSALFSLQPYISWKLWAGLKERKKEKKNPKQTKKPWTGSRLENWTTSSFGVHPCKETQPGEKVRKKKKIYRGKNF